MVAVQLQAAMRALEAMQELWGPECTLPSAHELLQRETQGLVLGKLSELRGETRSLRDELQQLRAAHEQSRELVFQKLPAALQAAQCGEPGPGSSIRAQVQLVAGS